MRSKALVEADKRLEGLGLSYQLIAIFGEATRQVLGQKIGAELDRFCAELSESDPEVIAVKSALVTALRSVVASMRKERDFSSAKVAQLLGAYQCADPRALEILRLVSAEISDQTGTD